MFENFDCGEEFDSLDDADIALLKGVPDEEDLELEVDCTAFL